MRRLPSPTFASLPPPPAHPHASTIAAIVVGLAVMLAHESAHAQSAASKGAEAAFREARQLMDAKDYAAACPKFVESQKLEPAAGTLLNLADCYEKNGQTTSAWSTFKDAAKAAAARNRSDWVATANQRIASLEPKLSTLAVTLAPASDLPSLRIERDGFFLDRAAWGAAMPVDPGAHVVTASAAGRKTWTKRLEVPTAKNIAVEVPVLETDAAASAPVVRKPPPRKEGPLLPPPPESGPEPMKIAGYVATGVGVVGLAVGTITGLAALGKRSDAENKCESYPSRCSAEGSAANDDAKQFATISTISLIAGGVLVAGGLVLILTSPKKADVQASRPLLLGGTF